MKTPLTIIILTHNEALHLERCLKNISNWAEEVIIIDGGPNNSQSSDGTLEIAEKYGAKIAKHSFENQAQQFNWALENIEIKNEWILRLDADEYLTEELKNEISEILRNTKEIRKYESTNTNGFLMKRRVYFMGRWIKHGGYYPTWFLRMFRKGKGKYEDKEMDEHLVVEGRVEKLKNDFIDENLNDLSWWTDKHNKYAAREAKAYILERENTRKLTRKYAKSKLGESVERKRKLKTGVYYKLPPFLRALLYWKYRYFIRLGFLDGKEGLIFHFLQGLWYRFLVDAKIYETKTSHRRRG